MNQRGHSGRVDANQAVIVQDLRAMGYSVAVVARVGGGFVDIVVGANGHNLLFEIKDPAQPKSARALTEDEAIFHRTWKGQVGTIETTAEAVYWIKRKIGEI